MIKNDAIAVTGLGLVTSLGLTPEDTFEAIARGERGLGPLAALEQQPTPDKGGGEALPLPASEAAGPTREVHYLRKVLLQALAAAEGHGYAPHRIAVVMGTTLHGMRAAGRMLRSGDLGELRAFSANAVLSSAVNGLPINGALMSTCSACSSGLAAIALGATLLRTDQADLVLAGGYDAVSEYAYAGFDSLRLVASGPIRPFGAQREGMKTAEGYAALALERAPNAESRRARVCGYLAGVGESADAHHLTLPHPEGRGAIAAMRTALGAAGVEVDSIGLISAHATSTSNNDAAEYAALSTVFGARLSQTPVVAFKSHIGHTLGAAGAVELILAILARERGLIPPTLNAEPTDPTFKDLRLLSKCANRARIHGTLNMSLGFGGANACAIVTSRATATPAMQPNRAVITGFGVVLPGAIGNEAFVEQLKKGPSAESTRGGPIDEAAVSHLLNARRVRRMSDYVKLTLAATNLACANAGIADVASFAAEACVLLGTCHGSVGFCQEYYTQIVREGMGAANPSLFAEGVPNSGSAQVSLLLGVRGGCQTIIGSRNAGLDALRLAALRIQDGAWTRAIVGAAEEHSSIVEKATQACEPKQVSGLVERTGAGAVTIIVESRRAAELRGARVLATVESSCAFSGAAVSRVTRAINHGNGPAAVLSALGSAQSDRAVARLIERSGSRPHWTISTLLPEMFSVGPLAALAAAISAPQFLPNLNLRSDWNADILGADSTGSVSCMRVLSGTG